MYRKTVYIGFSTTCGFRHTLGCLEMYPLEIMGEYCNHNSTGKGLLHLLFPEGYFFLFLFGFFKILPEGSGKGWRDYLCLEGILSFTDVQRVPIMTVLPVWNLGTSLRLETWTSWEGSG